MSQGVKISWDCPDCGIYVDSIKVPCPGCGGRFIITEDGLKFIEGSDVNPGVDYYRSILN